jgi:hypothetical protein
MSMANYETAEQREWREKLRRESIDKTSVLLPVVFGILYEIL